MNKALADLIKISKVTGKDSTLVAGGGGNTSVKTADGKYMYVKASGTALKDMNAEKGWRRLRIDEVLEITKDKRLAKLDANKREVEVVNRLLNACDDNISGHCRPSVESHLHAFLDRCVIHLHPLVVAAYVNSRDGRGHLDKLFKDEKIKPLWVPYFDPGFQLAKNMLRLIEEYKKAHDGMKPSVMILQKHGLFVTAETADSALRLVRNVIRLCSSGLKKIQPKKIKTPAQKQITAGKLAVRKAVFDTTSQYLQVHHFKADSTMSAFMQRKDAGRLVATAALNPDELVYANGPAMWVESCSSSEITKKLNNLIKKGQKPSAAFLIKNLGLFVAANKKQAQVIADITGGSLLVRMYASQFGGISALTKRQQDFINNWESEAFRKKQLDTSNDGSLKGNLAVVTGAGSGLGRSIATGLARAGAAVALADIDTKAAQETAELISKELSESQTLVVYCDVTKEESVDNAFEYVLGQWGGLDILVNAAGIAPAAELVDLDAKKWRFALEVNLTGYFLAAKAAARIMIQQAMGGSIINISSKSGIQASISNTAYNAAKAGQIHMARGWAMELGQYGIRVNSVCPGNVFEGSKIWNPAYIKQCAKKYNIKPEEVIPYYINKTILKREIKGQDVADSVVFLCSEKARTITGQILVPDSGQVMVR